MKLSAKAVPISKAAANVGRSIIIRGWIHRKRSSGGKMFAVVRDVTGTIQCVIDKGKVGEKEWSAIDSAYLESSVIVKGVPHKDERASGGVELSVEGLTVVHSGEQFPITEYQSPEFLLDVRHLWLRSQRMINIMKARAHIFRYARDFLDKRGFYEISPPLLTAAGGETGASMFEVQYFDQKVYLTESSQLYAEAMVPALEKVYALAPSYRAEKSRTTKHLTEYWHLEPEMAYFDNKKSMEFQEMLVSGIANRLAKTDSEILKYFEVDPESLKKIRPPFKRLTYEQALRLLNEKGDKVDWGDDFGVEEEKLLTENESAPMFVYNWPREIKPFYMPVNPKDDRTVLCADMLAPKGHGEIIGGSERIWRLDELMERLDEVEKAKGVKFDMDKYAWWIDLRKYGSVPHSGFGMGMERLIKWMLNLDHIRDSIPFPRMINRIKP
ncbi:MAG: asparagine--tRNA ligase [Candidatus Marsarchaeota archaeon]|jgi:asparaginyl-tRNA synthetase|nr:asparagine--tRNA ligase [Candidatus Marsarchaeota archaeon]MCL5112013.1 asparagine--tRNA ligase [Candidatus Marsarchaeota archaeon]